MTPKTTFEQPEKLKDVLKSVIDEMGENEILRGSISFDRKMNLGPFGYEEISNYLEINFNATVCLPKKTTKEP